MNRPLPMSKDKAKLVAWVETSCTTLLAQLLNPLLLTQFFFKEKGKGTSFLEL